MLEQFLNHIRTNKLLTAKDKVLLAVSGGMDSMVMLFLFKQAGLQAGVAHCNFQLRGAESDGDANLVMEIAGKYGFPLHAKKFNVGKYAGEKGLSTQMAARDLRYEWFNELAQEHAYTVIATAHHLNDVFETILLNLVRGTGLDGITGIPLKQKNIIRPLLFASRQQIESFAQENNINWREDSSNASDYYQRNLIRHKIIPLMREINPNLEGTFSDTLVRLSAGREFARSYLKEFSVRNIYYDGKHVLIKKEEIMKQPFPKVVLWELLKDLGFNFDQCTEIARGGHQPGMLFHSPDYQLTIDRDEFIVNRQTDARKKHVEILPDDFRATSPDMELSLEIIDADKFVLVKDKTIAQLDADRIQFPLLWRQWHGGDRFVPLGMQHHKKISDFLVDEKVSLPDKRNVTVVESQGEIIWVVGRRIADPYKVTGETKSVLVIKSDPRPPNPLKGENHGPLQGI